ncbi:permease-like cell division protein FtsX [Demequina salsinemoris]|uniref:permease-like cell division protein FtsX n=1 Tax=Demequina salsinemoris TaxID=577470 RepID=UPI0007813A9D|nr:permease-like cell division protein FtsX [Demequina salsinemoris]
MRLQFILGEVINGLRRNSTMALSVVLVTFVSLTFVGSAALIQTQIGQLQDDWYGKVEVSIFLCPTDSVSEQCAQGEATPAQEDAILAVLETGAVADLVEKVTYESKEEAYDNFVARADSSLTQYLTADQMQASFRVKLVDPSQFETVADATQGLSGVESVKDQREIFDNLFAFLNAATIVAAGLAAVMLLTAVLLITTTVRLSALSRKRETTIMKMVGSSRTLIQLPFMLEGAVAATTGAILATLALWFGVQYLVQDWLSSSVGWVDYVTGDDVLAIAPWLVVIAFGLAASASLMTLGRYTRA